MLYAGMPLDNDVRDGALRFVVQQTGADGAARLSVLSLATASIRMENARTKELLCNIPLRNIRSWNAFSEKEEGSAEVQGIMLDVVQNLSDDGTMLKLYSPQGPQILRTLGESSPLPAPPRRLRVPLAHRAHTALTTPLAAATPDDAEKNVWKLVEKMNKEAKAKANGGGARPQRKSVFERAKHAVVGDAGGGGAGRLAKRQSAMAAMNAAPGQSGVNALAPPGASTSSPTSAAAASAAIKRVTIQEPSDNDSSRSPSGSLAGPPAGTNFTSMQQLLGEYEAQSGDAVEFAPVETKLESFSNRMSFFKERSDSDGGQSVDYCRPRTSFSGMPAPKNADSPGESPVGGGVAEVDDTTESFGNRVEYFRRKTISDQVRRMRPPDEAVGAPPARRARRSPAQGTDAKAPPRPRTSRPRRR